jgi:hypothetical protein
MPRPFIPLLIIGFSLAGGCRRDGIQTYQIPKETPPDLGAGFEAKAAASAKELEWKVPAGWKEQTPSSMRIGSFLVHGENGQADMSVIPLTGEAGGDLANINRWRGQIALNPMTPADLSSQSETIAPGGRKMLYVNFVKGKKRLMAAIYHRKDRTWFFKLMGDDATVLSAKPAFVQFLRSLKFHEE